eukprot:TRINITY_DN7544_c0_g1_i1.p1 TRINITY_DN7544_c0_g1~~TRINITY_DN7544_c0_g1_i1.p1  ORF type:complete len:311 (+),score=147.39 TRINITY_DN7544_c0_g1_i1:50-982(+)
MNLGDLLGGVLNGNRVDSVRIPVANSLCGEAVGHDYSLKMQNHFTRAQYSGITEEINDIYKEGQSQFIVSLGGTIACSILPCFSGVFAMVSMSLFMLTLIGGLTLMCVFMAWMFYAIFSMMNARKKKMAKLCSKYSDRFPGTNWMYKEVGYGKYKSQYLEIEFQNVEQSVRAPQQQQPVQTPIHFPPSQQQPMQQFQQPMQQQFQQPMQQQQQQQFQQPMQQQQFQQPMQQQQQFQQPQQQQQQQFQQPMQQQQNQQMGQNQMNPMMGMQQPMQQQQQQQQPSAPAMFENNQEFNDPAMNIEQNDRSDKF